MKKKHNLIQFSHEFNSKHFLLKNIIKEHYERLKLLELNNFTIYITSNTKNKELFDFSITTFEYLNKQTNIIKNYYQIKLRNTTELPNIEYLLNKWNKYLLNDELILLFDISQLNNENKTYLQNILKKNSYYKYYLYSNRIILLTENILEIKDPTILYIVEYSKNIQSIDAISNMPYIY